MPQPDSRATLVAGPLANVSVQFKPTGLICDRICPIIDRVDPKAKIGVYNKGAYFRDEAGIRAPGTEAVRGGFPTSFLDINTKEYAFAKEVTDEDRRIAQSKNAIPLQPDQDALEFATTKIDLKKERRCRDLIVAASWADGNGAGGEDAAGLWAAGGSNTFLDDIYNGISVIQSKTGLLPNTLMLDLGTFLSLKKEATVLDKIKYTQRGVLTVELLAALLELEHVCIGSAVYSSAKENKAGTDFTAARIWEVNAGKGMGFLCYCPSAPGLRTPSACYQARTDYPDGSLRRVIKWREESRHQDVYEVAEQTDILTVSTDCGYLWKDTLLT